MIPPTFAAILLAGGHSQRMGCDKAFLEWQGGPLWQFQLGKLQTLKPTRLILSCRKEQQTDFGFMDPTVEWFFDPPDSRLGPLGIIYQALSSVQMPLVVLAVDMPRMTAEWMQVALLTQQTFDQGRCFSTAAGLEPLAALYVPGMLPIMAEHLTAGQLSLQKLLWNGVDQGRVEVITATANEAGCFLNCNTPSEWEHETGRSLRPA